MRAGGRRLGELQRKGNWGRVAERAEAAMEMGVFQGRFRLVRGERNGIRSVWVRHVGTQRPAGCGGAGAGPVADADLNHVRRSVQALGVRGAVVLFRSSFERRC